MQELGIKNISIGIDIEEISRFKNKTLEKDKIFLEFVYTNNELTYCFSKKNFAQHLAVRYCAKEAVIKSLSDSNNMKLQYRDIEILNNIDGSPYVSINKYKDLIFKISLSHTSKYAAAFVIKIN